MIKYSIKVSKREKELLQAIEEIKFGEIHGIIFPPGNYVLDCEEKVSAIQMELIEKIRGGAQEISVLRIHNGEPAYAEIDQKINGFSCRKKLKFPAE